MTVAFAGQLVETRHRDLHAWLFLGADVVAEPREFKSRPRPRAGGEAPTKSNRH